MSMMEQSRRWQARERARERAAGTYVNPRRSTWETVAQTLSRRSTRDLNGCLLWSGACDAGGYGTIACQGELLKTHRAAWVVANGPIPVGLSVLHRCDVRNCIEPAHLWLGTYADNSRDAVAKGRAFNIGGWNKGRPHSVETRAKIGERARQRGALGAEHRAKIGTAHKGRKHTAEHVAHWRAARGFIETEVT